MLSLMRWIIWGPVAAILDILPVNTARSIGKPAGMIACRIFGGRRREITEACRELFPEKSSDELNGIVRYGFVLRCMTEIENIMFKRLNSESIQKIIEIEGLNRLDKSLNKGKGVLLVTLHFGAHLYPMPALGYSGYVIHQLAGEFDPSMDGEEETAAEKKLHKHRLERSEGKLAGNVILAGSGRSIRPVFRALNSNEIVIIAVDGRRYGKLEEFPFLGADKYFFSLGCADLALRSGAMVHPIAVVRQPSGINRLIICDAMDPSGYKEDKGAYVMVSDIVKTLEPFVRDYPDHYIMEMLAEYRRVRRMGIVKDNVPVEVG